MNHINGEKYNFLMDIIFTPMSWVMGAAISLMDFMRIHGLMKTEESSLPLISVGNLTYGGTNKTPFVEMLAEYANSRGIKTSIVTRGYTGRSKCVTIIRNGEGKRDIAGDEPLLLSRKLPDIPVAIARQRIEGVNALRDSGIELVIADDAFQHRSLARDCDIVLIDSICPFGSGKLTPAGVMREKINALSRADIVVLTKADMVTNEELESLRERVKEYVPEEKIFTSVLKHDGWLMFGMNELPRAGMKVFAFSAIGSPESFRMSVSEHKLILAGEKHYRDHHRYTHKELESLCMLAEKNNADAMICTEKDLYNLPEQFKWNMRMPLIVPKVKAVVNEQEKFFDSLTECMKPEIIIASNGYGEDAIGVMLAKKFKRKLSHSNISAFPLVGKGDAYSQAGFAIKSAPSVTPSGGVVKYSLRDLLGDMRAGLLKHVNAQLKDWKKIAGRIRTPVCVGDVYLLLHTLWGSGMRPMFCATAKTVYLSGHWRIERALINRFTLRTWTRDEESAKQLGKRAVYSGSPIMDLLYEDDKENAKHSDNHALNSESSITDLPREDDEENAKHSGNRELYSESPIMNLPCEDYKEIHEHAKGNVILLLPGSRKRACNDVKLILDAVKIIAKTESHFRMVLAPTLPIDEFFDSCRASGWNVKDNELVLDDIHIELTNEPIARAVDGVKVLLGLGGTANQLCAGLGIPVISIDEKGKRVQKKLLGDSEILVRADANVLADTLMRVLNDESLYESMSIAGVQRMGKPGALDDIVNYACDKLGWSVRERVYMMLKGN